jgi:hypothetical protein
LGTIPHQSLRQMGRGRLSALDCREHVEGNAFPLFIHFAIPLRRIVNVGDKNGPLASPHFSATRGRFGSRTAPPTKNRCGRKTPDSRHDGG